MHDHQVSRPRARCKLQERGQKQPNLLTISYDSLIAFSNLPTRIREDEIGTADLLQHPAGPARDRSRRGIVKKVGIEASRKFEVVGSGALAARDMLLNVCCDEA